MGAGQALGDRLAQMEAMDGAARCLEVLRIQGRICNCRPLEFNTRLLEVATSVGAKVRNSYQGQEFQYPVNQKFVMNFIFTYKINQLSEDVPYDIVHDLAETRVSLFLCQ